MNECIHSPKDRNFFKQCVAIATMRTRIGNIPDHALRLQHMHIYLQDILRSAETIQNTCNPESKRWTHDESEIIKIYSQGLITDCKKQLDKIIS